MCNIGRRGRWRRRKEGEKEEGDVKKNKVKGEEKEERGWKECGERD